VGRQRDGVGAGAMVDAEVAGGWRGSGVRLRKTLLEPVDSIWDMGVDELRPFSPTLFTWQRRSMDIELTSSPKSNEVLAKFVAC
jgi:hypothetical protein